MKLMIGIPAFNEQQTIGNVIKSIPGRLKGVHSIDIVIVDDGSTDSTVSIAKKYGVSIILHHLINRGLGGALKTLFTFARQKHFDILVTIDADGQHEGKDIPRIIKPIISKRSDVVIGSRWRNSDTHHIMRRIINQLANVLTYFLFGIWCTDTQSGFRAFDRKAIKSIILQSDGMEVSSEFFKEIYRNKLELSEIPIVPIYTEYSRKKGQRITNSPSVLFQLAMKFLR